MHEFSHRMPIIPPTQLVVSSHSAYETRVQRRLNPTNNVGGSFILSLTAVGVGVYLSTACTGTGPRKVGYERTTNCVGGIRARACAIV
jgi:hypothetical protein